MRAFVVSGLVFFVPSQEIGLWKRLRNDLYCVEWDVKPQLNRSINGVRRCYYRHTGLVVVVVLGQLHQSRVSATVPSRAPDQAAASGIHHPHPTVDVCPIVQGNRKLSLEVEPTTYQWQIHGGGEAGGAIAPVRGPETIF